MRTTARSRITRPRIEPRLSCERGRANATASHSACLLSGLEDLRHCGGEGAPSAFLKFLLVSPKPSQFIILGAAIFLRYSPARGDPALALQTMERGIQRALLHKQNFSGNLVDALRNRPAVLGLQRRRCGESGGPECLEEDRFGGPPFIPLSLLQGR